MRDELTTGEVATLLGFGPTIVAKWASQGHLVCRVTPGGHRRYMLADVQAFEAKMKGEGFGPHKLSRGRAADGLPHAPRQNPQPEKKVLQKLTKILKKPGIKQGK